jgi:hypothetical protein
MKKIGLYILLISLFFVSCKRHNIQEQTQWASIFKKYNVDSACFELADNSHEQVFYYNLNRLATPYTPASTFKIMNSLKDKTVIITGAASGMGKAIAYLVASEGAKVVVSDVNQLAIGFLVSCDYYDPGSMNFSIVSDPNNQNQNPGFTVTVTSMSGSRCVGTFSGTIKDLGGNPITVTNGIFNVPF